MFGWFRRNRNADVVERLYGGIVAQARSPVFYTHYRVPDTSEARFEMIVMHLVLTLTRLHDEGDVGHQLGQDLFDHFISDMDASLREMGVGDLTVPKKIKVMGSAFYGRLRAYGECLGRGEGERLAGLLATNIAETVDGAGLSAYMVQALAALRAETAENLLHGQIGFPQPAGGEEQGDRHGR